MEPIVVIVIVVLVVLALAAAAWYFMRRRALRQRFGPEYDRVVAERESRTEAERELRERERRHAQLELRELSAESRARYAASWEEIQAKFVDSPGEAVAEGDELVTRLIAERGYPTENYEDQLATLSVEHARTLGHYRDAHDIQLRNQSGEASTEQLRQALVHYRALFADLLGDDPIRRHDEDRTDSARNTADSREPDAHETDAARDARDAETAHDARGAETAHDARDAETARDAREAGGTRDATRP